MSFAQMHNDYLDPDRHAAPELTEGQARAGRYAQQIRRHFEAKTWGNVYRTLYKGTSCGVTVGVVLEGADHPLYCDDLYKIGFDQPVVAVHISSIVEGVDYGTDTEVVDLTEPGNRRTGTITARIFKACDLVEAEAESIWNQTHGCESCQAHWIAEGVEDGEIDGAVPVWKECPDCQGCGTII